MKFKDYYKNRLFKENDTSLSPFPKGTIPEDFLQEAYLRLLNDNNLSAIAKIVKHAIDEEIPHVGNVIMWDKNDKNEKENIIYQKSFFGKDISGELVIEKLKNTSNYLHLILKINMNNKKRMISMNLKTDDADNIIKSL